MPRPPRTASFSAVDVGHAIKAVELCTQNKLKSVLRTISRLETVYLAIGSFEQGWKVACKRGHVGLEVSPDDDDGSYSIRRFVIERHPMVISRSSF
jgi:hypothetical protein